MGRGIERELVKIGSNPAEHRLKLLADSPRSAVSFEILLLVWVIKNLLVLE